MTPLEYIEDSEPVDGSRNQWRAVQWANTEASVWIQTKLNNSSNKKQLETDADVYWWLMLAGGMLVCQLSAWLVAV